MPVGSQTDPPLTRAQPINNNSSVSELTYLGRGIVAIQLQMEKRVRICESSRSADTNASETEGGRGVPGARAEVPLELVV
ncbi:protein pxr1-like [Pitangus sulphuratus]|nr:protein pxr1-like [Pitangus sulphuratus]